MFGSIHLKQPDQIAIPFVSVRIPALQISLL